MTKKAGFAESLGPLIILRTTVSIGTTRNGAPPEIQRHTQRFTTYWGDRVYYVGNMMIETLFRYRERGRASSILEMLSVESRGYSLLTLHRVRAMSTRKTLSAPSSGLSRGSRQRVLSCSRCIRARGSGWSASSAVCRP